METIVENVEDKTGSETKMFYQALCNKAFSQNYLLKFYEIQQQWCLFIVLFCLLAMYFYNNQTFFLLLLPCFFAQTVEYLLNQCRQKNRI